MAAIAAVLAAIITGWATGRVRTEFPPPPDIRRFVESLQGSWRHEPD